MAYEQNACGPNPAHCPYGGASAAESPAIRGPVTPHFPFHPDRCRSCTARTPITIGTVLRRYAPCNNLRATLNDLLRGTNCLFRAKVLPDLLKRWCDRCYRWLPVGWCLKHTVRTRGRIMRNLYSWGYIDLWDGARRVHVHRLLKIVPGSYLPCHICRFNLPDRCLESRPIIIANSPEDPVS